MAAVSIWCTRAQETPSTGFIGVEPFVNSMAKLLAKVDEIGLKNVRVYDDDADSVIGLVAGSVESTRSICSIPTHGRRKSTGSGASYRASILIASHRVLKPGGLFCFASDIDTYVNWTLTHCRDHGGFVWLAEEPADWLEPYSNWPSTRYEAKARREGRSSAYLTFRKG